MWQNSGPWSRRLSVGLALLLLSCSAYAQSSVPVYNGPPLPAGWAAVHETELQAWQDELTLQSTLTAQLRTLLLTAQQQLSIASSSLTKSTQALNEAKAFSTALEADVNRLIRQRDAAVIGAITAIILAIIAAIAL